MKNDDNIEISPKYGLNATVSICFWCGESKNELALMGRVRHEDNDDVEAPKEMIIDYEPCDKCKKDWDKGIAFIECITEQPEDGRAPIAIHDGIKNYPTGRYFILTEEGARHFGANDEIIKARKALISTKDYNEIMSIYKQKEN